MIGRVEGTTSERLGGRKVGGREKLFHWNNHLPRLGARARCAFLVATTVVVVDCVRQARSLADCLARRVVASLLKANSS